MYICQRVKSTKEKSKAEKMEKVVGGVVDSDFK